MPISQYWERHDDEECQEQRAVVAAPGRGQAHKFAQGEEGKDCEEHQRDNSAKHEGGAKNRDDAPPGADSGI
jgi:hypothetical protein